MTHILHPGILGGQFRQAEGQYNFILYGVIRSIRPGFGDVHELPIINNVAESGIGSCVVGFKIKVKEAAAQAHLGLHPSIEVVQRYLCSKELSLSHFQTRISWQRSESKIDGILFSLRLGYPCESSEPRRWGEVSKLTTHLR